MSSTPQHVRDEIIRLGHQGLFGGKIAKQLGIAKNTAVRVLREAGFEPADKLVSEESKAILAKKWMAGEPTSKIGEELGIKSGAVMARAKKMGLPRRPNAAVFRPGHVKKVQRSRAEYLAERAEKARLAAEERARVAAEKKAARPAKAPKVRVSKAKAVTPKPIEPPKVAAPVYTQTEAHRIANTAFGPDGYHDSACMWPVGRPGRLSFRYCNALREGDRNYCEAHRAIAYQKRGEAQVSPASEYRLGRPEMRVG